MTVTVPASDGFGKAELQLDIDDAEHERRRAAGLGVATGHGFGGLDVLMTLPHGLPVPVADLTDHQRAYVRRAPAGLCTVAGQNVTRPCRVTLATVRTNSPTRMALDAASQFAPFCARRVVITRPLSRLRSPNSCWTAASTALASSCSTPTATWKRWWNRGPGVRSGTPRTPGGSRSGPTNSSSSSHPARPLSSRPPPDPAARRT